MKSLNKNQKTISYIFLTLIVIIIFIHNPTGGYINKSYTAAESEMDYKTSKYIHRDNGENCRKEYKFSEWPGGKGYEENVCEYNISILYWQSESALIWWFGAVINVIWAIIFSAIIFVITFFAFKDKSA
jgi:hypothetical protein